MNSTTLFDNNWMFAKTPLEHDIHQYSEFMSVDLPHDWLIYNSLDIYENSIGWYKKIR